MVQLAGLLGEGRARILCCSIILFGFFCWDVAIRGGCFLQVFAFEGRLVGLFGSVERRVFFGCS
jgi:hypothetical protein